jgi:hypothetical protein
MAVLDICQSRTEKKKKTRKEKLKPRLIFCSQSSTTIKMLNIALKIKPPRKCIFQIRAKKPTWTLLCTPDMVEVHYPHHWYTALRWAPDHLKNPCTEDSFPSRLVLHYDP